MLIDTAAARSYFDERTEGGHVSFGIPNVPGVSMVLTAEQIIDLLHLEPHPTCGLVKQTYVSKTCLRESALPAGFRGDRPVGSVLYFMVSPRARTKLHRIRSDQMYHHYLGDPLEVLLLYSDGSGEVKVLGPDLAAGMRPQLFIPGTTFHVSRVAGNGRYALLGTSEWVGVEPEDVELGDPRKLRNTYPALANEIDRFTG